MGLVYIYLMAWVLGGVLLGSTMLLEHREQGLVEPTTPRPGLNRAASFATFALIGFGLCGLAAEGLGLVASPWTALWALVGGTVLAGIGYTLANHTRGAR